MEADNVPIGGGAKTSGWGLRYRERKRLVGGAVQHGLKAPGPGAPEHEKWDEANALLFGTLCCKFELIAAMRGRTRDKLLVLFNFEENWLPKAQSLFPIMRLVLPQLEKYRLKYGLLEKSLAQLYKKALTLSRANQRLLEFHTGETRDSFGGSDLGPTIKTILESEMGISKRFEATIKDANDYLDALAYDDCQEKTLRVWKIKFTPLEHKWLVRIICGQLKIGMKETCALNFVIHGGYDLYKNGQDLQSICALVASGDHKTVEIDLFKRFSPMLATGFASADDQFDEVQKKVGSAGFLVDEKVDGHRYLCHKGGGRIEFYSRTKIDHTETYGPILHQAVENLACETCILDGELVVVDSADPRLPKLPFGNEVTVALLERGVVKEKQPVPEGWTERMLCDARLRYICYDMLYLDGECLTKLELRYRRRRLSELLEKSPSSLERLAMVQHDMYDDDRPLYSPEERRTALVKLYDSVVAEGGEGVVVKKLDSPYVCECRKYWFKIKPDYDNARIIDAVVVGGFWSTMVRGARTGKMGNFLCSVLHPESQKYASLVQVGSGYNAQEHSEILGAIGEDNWTSVCSQDEPPSWWHGAFVTGDKKPDKIVKSVEDSVVLELKCYEVLPSTKYSAKATLRIVRVNRVRRDKSPRQVDTTETIEAYLRAPKHLSRHPRPRDSPGKKKRRSSAAVDPCLSVAIDHVSHKQLRMAGKQIFVGKDTGQPLKFVVWRNVKLRTTSDTLTKPAIEKLIAANGGMIMATAVASVTDFCFVSSPGSDLLLLDIETRRAERTVLDAAWIARCVVLGRYVEPRPRDYLSASKGDALHLALHYDPLIGASLSSRRETPAELKACFYHASANRATSNFYRGSEASPRMLSRHLDHIRDLFAPRVMTLKLRGFTFLVAPNTAVYQPLLAWFGAVVVFQLNTSDPPTHALILQGDPQPGNLPERVQVLTPACLYATVGY